MRIQKLQFFTIYIAIGCFQVVHAQYKTAFQLNDDSIKIIYFEALQVSKINLETYSGQNFYFESSAEGSYKSDLYFDHEVQNDSLIIKSIFPKNLLFGDNKMTAMQEFSVSINFKLPENLKLVIYSDVASISGSGTYKHLQIETKSGNCLFDKLRGDTNINSFSGSIHLKAKDANVKAKTQSGKVTLDTFYYKKYYLKLRTVHGDISVESIED